LKSLDIEKPGQQKEEGTGIGGICIGNK